MQKVYSCTRRTKFENISLPSSRDSRVSLVYSILYLSLMLTVCVILGNHIHGYSVSSFFNKHQLL